VIYLVQKNQVRPEQDVIFGKITAIVLKGEQPTNVFIAVTVFIMKWSQLDKDVISKTAAAVKQMNEKYPDAKRKKI